MRSTLSISGQGELGKVAEDPLKHPELFQQFLDRHPSLRDLVETEQALVTSLRENAGRLNPLETAFAQLAAKKQSLLEIENKVSKSQKKAICGTSSESKVNLHPRKPSESPSRRLPPIT